MSIPPCLAESFLCVVKTFEGKDFRSGKFGLESVHIARMSGAEEETFFKSDLEKDKHDLVVRRVQVYCVVHPSTVFDALPG